MSIKTMPSNYSVIIGWKYVQNEYEVTTRKSIYKYNMYPSYGVTRVEKKESKIAT